MCAVTAHASGKTKELTLREVIAKYKDVSPFVIIKSDVTRRSFTYTDRALKALDRSKHQYQQRVLIGSNGDMNAAVPVSLLLRDGTSIIAMPSQTAKNPYVVDQIDGRLYITDHGEIVEEVEYWYKPDYYDQFTSSGTPMWQVASSRPQRLDIDPNSHCHFWNKGNGCKFCNINANSTRSYQDRNMAKHLQAQDVYETVREALKQPGAFTNLKMSSGSILSGAEIFDDEVEMYIEMLQAAGDNFKEKKFPSTIVASAFNERQLAKIYENTGLMTYTSDIEIPNEALFAWICKGKHKEVGYQEWKRRIIAAVDIFGAGNVSSGIVGGCEMAAPHGFTDETEALKAVLEEAEDFASQGVSVVHCVWVPLHGSAFHNQRTPSLEYYVQLAKGLSDIRAEYRLNIDMDNYRKCGNHPDTDLDRGRGGAAVQ
ncbi:radical SAM protein [Paenibacillus sp. S150]|uniref:radical SAM protein n=1 Tax=Paenibacillus sp. S150 TaxID=2749826 RepID=UPI001C597013|nr:radical SAM protein [Paenibacillus sp. S150]MBW4080998.1 radical SAM protein [Paenibacillus sp. S150]